MLTYLKFRWQRVFRKFARNTRGGFKNLLIYSRYNVWGKWRQFAMIRRFALIWVALVVVCGFGLIVQTRHLVAQGSVLRPLAGGQYTEAVVGQVKTVNPILPDNSASADAVKLVFSGLTKFTAGGELEGDLATDWKVSEDGKAYTFHLRHNVVWHDGVPFTSQDVLFTLAAIQNPDTRSPLALSWQGVKVDAPDDFTVVFSLPKPYTPFINTTTVGILPRHLLENTEPRMMRVATFNQRPVGTGPFKLSRLDVEAGELVFTRNDSYFNGKPLLDQVTLRTFSTGDQAYQAYSRRQVQGVSRLRPNQLEDAQKTGTMKIYEAGVPDQVGVFFHTTSGVTADKTVRAALAQATDRRAIIDKQFNGLANGLSGPLNTSGLNLAGIPHQANFNQIAARQTLEAGGWKLNREGVRVKDGKLLEIKMVTQSDTAYGEVAKQVAQQWKAVGAKVDVQEVDATSLQQSYIRPRHYDAILYGINVGSDPDVYAYWHSSQASDPGLNLSSYASSVADKALEGGRTLRDTATRSAKYKAFVQTWVSDNPAVMLYAPTYLYGVDDTVHGISIGRLVTPSDRLDGIEHWAVKVKSVVRSH